MSKRAGTLVLSLTLAWPAAAPAMVSSPGADLRQYVHARLADSEGMPEAAASSYARLLQTSPQDQRLALRAYHQAITAGDFKLAATAAHQLDKLGVLPGDGTLMLFAEAITNRDWDRASTLVKRVNDEQIFSFLTPAMRGWIAFAKHAPDPAQATDAKSQLANAYANDHYLLIALASGRTDVLADLRRMVAARDSRALRLQLAAAALLAKRGDLPNARAILDGPAPELAVARATLAAGRPLRGAIDTPALGISELFAQLAVDVKGDGRSPISLQLARIASYLAPDNSGALIATADILSANDYHDAALALLARVPADDPLAEAARQERNGILMATGDREAALADVKKRTAQPDADANDFAELGGILSDMNRPADAARAYQRAIELDTKADRPRWAHMFLRAGALDTAGDWPAAKALLLDANRLSPGQAIILNYLGYGMLDHGEPITDAQAYIERASGLDPNDAAIADSLGWLYFKRGNYAGAIAALERAVTGDPGQSVMNEHLGDAYWAAGRRIEARYAWRAALVQADKPGAERINKKLTDGDGTALTSK